MSGRFRDIEHVVRAAVLFAAGFQVVQWSLTEAEERRASENLQESQAQLSVAFDETPVPMAMIAPDGVLLRTNAAYREWLRLPEDLPAGLNVRELTITPVDPGEAQLFRELTEHSEPVTLTRPAPAGSTVAVTLERSDGAPAPTMKPIVLAKVSA